MNDTLVPVSGVVAVAVGGGLGAAARYVSIALLDTVQTNEFPLGTLAVNVVGCFLIGLLGTTILGEHAVRTEVRLAIVVGVLGGFTTFSTFGMDTLELLLGGQVGKAALYIIASNAAGLLAVWGGFAIAQRFAGGEVTV
jgi:CrcB protein